MRNAKNKQGLTLIEILIAIAISSIIGVGLVSLQYLLSQNQIAITKSYKSIDDANFTASSMVKEIRMARQSDNGAYLLYLAGDQELIFYSDIDLDGQAEWIRYYLSETNLIKEIIEPTGYPAIYDLLSKTSSTVIEGVRNGSEPIFYYYNEDWPDDKVNNPLTADNRLAETKTIKIYLQVNQENNPEKDYTIESFTQIRSVKENM
jgi:prepilin-type N-terminal cleavage/methylation domain-containing protein